MWYNSSRDGWGSKAVGRNTSIVDAEVTPTSPVKPSAGRIIRIVNNMDHCVQVSKIYHRHSSNHLKSISMNE